MSIAATIASSASLAQLPEDCCSAASLDDDCSKSLDDPFGSTDSIPLSALHGSSMSSLSVSSPDPITTNSQRASTAATPLQSPPQPKSISFSPSKSRLLKRTGSRKRLSPNLIRKNNAISPAPHGLQLYRRNSSDDDSLSLDESSADQLLDESFEGNHNMGIGRSPWETSSSSSGAISEDSISYIGFPSRPAPQRSNSANMEVSLRTDEILYDEPVGEASQQSRNWQSLLFNASGSISSNASVGSPQTTTSSSNNSMSLSGLQQSGSISLSQGDLLGGSGGKGNGSSGSLNDSNQFLRIDSMYGNKAICVNEDENEEAAQAEEADFSTLDPTALDGGSSSSLVDAADDDGLPNSKKKQNQHKKKKLSISFFNESIPSEALETAATASSPANAIPQSLMQLLSNMGGLEPIMEETARDIERELEDDVTVVMVYPRPSKVLKFEDDDEEELAAVLEASSKKNVSREDEFVATLSADHSVVHETLTDDEELDMNINSADVNDSTRYYRSLDADADAESTLSFLPNPRIVENNDPPKPLVSGQNLSTTRQPRENDQTDKATTPTVDSSVQTATLPILNKSSLIPTPQQLAAMECIRALAFLVSIYS